jgi:hypothetical protein
MGWDRNTSLQRIEARWKDRNREIEVAKLAREMDLENIKFTRGKRILGAHVYATVSGSGKLTNLGSDAEAQSAIQRLALWQAEVARIAKTFEVPIIAFQGARAHFLNYRPIDDESDIARKSVLLARAISLMTWHSFNPLFEDDEAFNARAAADIGETVGTRGGSRGDSELLFLGSPANRPAKLLGTNRVTVTKRLRAALGDQLPVEAPNDDDSMALTLSKAEVEAETSALGIAWSTTLSSTRLADDLEKWPANRFGVSGATTRIDPKALSRSKSKRVQAAVIVADIDGFSAYIDEAENDDVKRDAIVTLDAIRQELRAVLKTDHDGVRIQYQGDNTIGVVHLPNGGDAAIAKTAIEIAAAMQSSIEDTLPQHVPDAGRLHLAVGIAFSDTVVASLGDYAKRNALVIGPAATKAEQIQMRLDAHETGISKPIYDLLTETLQELFTWDQNKKAYVAKRLDAAKLSRIQDAQNGAESQTLSKGRDGVFAIGTTAAAGGAISVPRRKPYAE